MFVSTASLGRGQKSTVIATLSTFTHQAAHGIIFVPLGYAKIFPQLTNLSEVHGGESPTFSTLCMTLLCFRSICGDAKPVQ